MIKARINNSALEDRICFCCGNKFKENWIVVNNFCGECINKGFERCKACEKIDCVNNLKGIEARKR